MIPAFVDSRPDLATALVLGWLGAGAALALTLHQRGHPAGVTLTALLAWPVMLPLLQARDAPASAGLTHPIDRVFSALRAALSVDGPIDAALADQLDALLAALHQADARVSAVDALLAEPNGDLADHPGVKQAQAALREGRSRARGEIEQVLAEVVQLRLHLGLHALAGAPGEVRERLSALEARTRAAHEVNALPGAPRVYR